MKNPIHGLLKSTSIALIKMLVVGSVGLSLGGCTVLVTSPPAGADTAGVEVLADEGSLPTVAAIATETHAALPELGWRLEL